MHKEAGVYKKTPPARRTLCESTHSMEVCTAWRRKLCGDGRKVKGGIPYVFLLL